MVYIWHGNFFFVQLWERFVVLILVFFVVVLLRDFLLIYRISKKNVKSMHQFLKYGFSNDLKNAKLTILFTI